MECFLKTERQEQPKFIISLCNDELNKLREGIEIELHGEYYGLNIDILIYHANNLDELLKQMKRNFNVAD